MHAFGHRGNGAVRCDGEIEVFCVVKDEMVPMVQILPCPLSRRIFMKDGCWQKSPATAANGEKFIFEVRCAKSPPFAF